ncbi:uncharacterized protein LOC109722857 [Ananas comosus]|uniref:Uncharacterized protein LOC109722857 n=1 Tax=Ananas comosus TaxID=4615 RepID=A0A199W5X6_ANACO|nr:uncharacterized protein LOC109722857 [Ananas comosus]XP_020106614.1 uncharacterized protein LOC109722857 [Ananas comosus]XP_020106615.1 uncharacterized protein LOC109722857 [Ananas comosus]OAY84887.1 hypothetical protein ACMD2_18860 [Ananas comosus]
MSQQNGARGSKVDLRLNVSPPTRGEASRRMAVDSDSSSNSSPSSCLSSENEQGLRCSGSPEATSMVLAGCPRCLMYVMLSEEDPKCPKCKSPVLLDFLAKKNGKS